MERLKRITAKLADPPGRRVLFRERTWRSAWASLREGLEMLCEHFEDLLEHEGIEPILCTGRPFDPKRMKAIAFERTDAVTPGTVREELAGGYLYNGRVLKFAEVKVAVEKGDH
jgi:molecular chaperone GrpE (heat shock protein)